MKLKQLVVASMSVLGLISFTAYADPAAADATQQPVKHKHHHHKMVKHYQVVRTYKDMGALPVAPIETCPRVDMYTLTLDSMSQNLGRAKPTVGCNNPISFAGGMNFDSTWGNRHQGYSGENTARFSLSDAYVNIYGIVNDWTTAFASISYTNYQPFVTGSTRGTGSSITGVGFSAGNNYLLNGIYSASYTHDNLDLEQGFVTFKNTDVLPVFLRLGKEFTDFGRYEIHPMTESFTQVMSESLHTQAQLGFLTGMGLNGSVYTFENPMSRNRTLPLNPATNGLGSDGHNRNNYGLSLNFDMPGDALGWGVGAGYMYDFTGVDQVAYGVETFNSGFAGTGTPAANATSRGNLLGQNGTYQSRVSGGTLYARLNTGPFDLNVHYVTAMQSFNALDLPTRTQAAINAGGTQIGAKPWSADITGAYGFNAWGHDQNVYLGYQGSGNAMNLYLPRNRILVGYGMGVWKNTNLGIQWNHDNAYSAGYGGSGQSSNGVMVRAGVQFG